MVSIFGRRCALIFGAATCLLFFGFAPVAGAEGRCPPGQYPIGGQGVGGCAPIPGGDAGAGQTGPVQTGHWNKTWGAIAMASNGDVGVSVGKVRKADASNEALANCSQHGASDCKVTQIYKNQCVALVSPRTSAFGGSTFGRAESVSAATSLAMGLCTKRGSEGCKVIYSACSEPEFESF